jgi:hypothetical protein
MVDSLSDEVDRELLKLIVGKNCASITEVAASDVVHSLCMAAQERRWTLDLLVSLRQSPAQVGSRVPSIVSAPASRRRILYASLPFLGLTNTWAYYTRSRRGLT